MTHRWRGLTLSCALATFAVATGPLGLAPARATGPGAQRACQPSSAAASCEAMFVTSGGTPLVTSGPVGYGPAQFHGEYSLPTTAKIAQTIAIVDPYDDPTAKADLDTYDAAFGLPAFPDCSATLTTACFQKVNQDGQPGPLPVVNSGWDLEISIDVQIAHALCQNCKILLVEADGSSGRDLSAAEDTAAVLGATEISNSYGQPEGQSFSPAAFDHPGIAIVAASGDSGNTRDVMPAAFPTVVAVGGTSLFVDSHNRYASETVWPGTGSGCSTIFPAQPWQTSLRNWNETGCKAKRGVADVAADANPATGAAVYDSTPLYGLSGWWKVGGTSLAAPIIAGVFALAGNAGTVDYPASIPYANRSQLHDVTTGSNGRCGTIMCNAGPGYDGPTGVGTPNGVRGF
jgi:hypothetical protein